MREWLFVFLYGALAMVGLFLTLFWTSISQRRAAFIGGRWMKRSDRYFMLALAIAVMSCGGFVLFGFRLFGNITYGLSPILRDTWDGFGVAAGLCLMLLGKTLLVWLADLEKQPPAWTWTRWFAAVTVVWGLAAVAVSAFIPLWETKVG